MERGKKRGEGWWKARNGGVLEVEQSVIGEGSERKATEHAERDKGRERERRGQRNPCITQKTDAWTSAIWAT